MSNKNYVDKFAAPLLAELDRAICSQTKAKDELFEKLKNRLIDELEVSEKVRNNQVKMEEQMKIEVEKNVTLEVEKRALKELLANKEEIIKVLTDGSDRKKGYSR